MINKILNFDKWTIYNQEVYYTPDDSLSYTIDINEQTVNPKKRKSESDLESVV